MTPDYLKIMDDEGYVSTNVLSKKLGLPSALHATWIVDTLKIHPVKINKGVGYFWTLEQVEEVRHALVDFLLNASAITKSTDVIAAINSATTSKEIVDLLESVERKYDLGVLHINDDEWIDISRAIHERTAWISA